MYETRHLFVHLCECLYALFKQRNHNSNKQFVIFKKYKETDDLPPCRRRGLQLVQYFISVRYSFRSFVLLWKSSEIGSCFCMSCLIVIGSSSVRCQLLSIPNIFSFNFSSEIISKSNPFSNRSNTLSCCTCRFNPGTKQNI
jgi:hypothetical protein